MTFLIGLCLCFLGGLAPMVNAHDLIVDGSGYALWHGKKYRCATGEKGLVPGEQRVEGSNMTPTGSFRILYVLSRPDRVTLPSLPFRVQPITPESAWCCQKNSPHYNTYVHKPTSLQNTTLYLDVDWFDVIAVLDYNTPGGTLGKTPVTKPVQGVGYGIFMHVRKPNYQPSRGCVGFAREDLIKILSQFNPEKDRVVIRSS